MATATRVRVVRTPRDQIGHWTAQPTGGRPCPHACCAGKRVHPGNLPVRLDRAYLRSLSQEDLEREVGQYQNYQDTHEAGYLQLVAEDSRRYQSQTRAQDRKLRASERRRQANDQHRDEVYRSWLQAENATRGVMLNRAGLAAGIDERSLFVGPESRVRKYASPELVEYFESHPRPTRETFTSNSRQRQEALSRRRIGLWPAPTAHAAGMTMWAATSCG